MNKKEILQKLEAVKLLDILNEEDRIALNEAISIIKKSKKWENCKRAVDILVRIFSIGSDYFN